MKRSYLKKITAHYKVTALDSSVSKELAMQLHKLPKEKQQKALQDFVDNQGLSGEDISELMYDIYKEGFKTLSKPTPSKSPNSSSSISPIISKIKSGQIDKQLGQTLENLDKLPSNPLLINIEKYFKSNPKEYGKFISDAEKNSIGFYEKNIGIPITVDALKNVSDEYILNSILYDCVYDNSKNLSMDAIAYAYDRFDNPFKSYIKMVGGSAGVEGQIFGGAAEVFKHSRSQIAKMEKWFDGLDKQSQDNIRDDFKDYSGLNISLDDYFSL